MKAGIAIDSWKLKIFERRLKKAKYVYEVHPGIAPDTLTLTVEYTDHDALLTLSRAANVEAARTASPKH